MSTPRKSSRSKTVPGKSAIRKTARTAKQGAKEAKGSIGKKSRQKTGLRSGMWRRVVIPLLIVAVGIVGWATTLTWAYRNTQLPQVLRDMVIALVAHTKAGEDIPIDAGLINYSGGTAQDIDETWGIETNSIWLVRQTMQIVPLLYYEEIGGGIYPDGVIFVPYLGIRSFHVGGTMDCRQYAPRAVPICLVILNERYLTDPGWNDARSLLSTLIHETIHLQGGLFLDDPNVQDWPTQSAHLEAKTSAATMEALAALCNYQNEIACRAFWAEIESMARATLRYRLREAPWLYNGFANIFLRDGIDERTARKSARYWGQHQDELYDILNKYQMTPYENMLLVGTKYGLPLNTGVLVYDEFDSDGNPTQGHYLNMPWDDTYDLLGFWAWWLNLLTPI